MKRFFGFTDAADVVDQFATDAQENILFAVYEYENWEVAAFVIFERENKLYEVYGSHCSYHGLEGQWYPEESFPEELLNRLERGDIYINDEQAKKTAIAIVQSFLN